jgi:hypothetical protein
MSPPPGMQAATPQIREAHLPANLILGRKKSGVTLVIIYPWSYHLSPMECSESDFYFTKNWEYCHPILTGNCSDSMNSSKCLLSPYQSDINHSPSYKVSRVRNFLATRSISPIRSCPRPDRTPSGHGNASPFPLLQDLTETDWSIH